MNPQKATRRIADAFRNDELDVMIVLATGKKIRGRITGSAAATEGLGAPGEMVAGFTSITLTIEVGQ